MTLVFRCARAPAFAGALLCSVAFEAVARAEEAAAPAVEVIAEGERPHPGASARSRSVSASVISGERLLQPGTSTAAVLREAPGIQVSEMGGLGAPATASVRGATAAQTPVYFAGVRVNDEVGGAADLADLPLFLIDRIEVYRSHAPLFADRMGIGGAIFLEPKSATSNEVVTGAELGSYGTRAGSVYSSMASDQRGLLAGVEFAVADNDYAFLDDRGTLFTSADDSGNRLDNADVRLSSGWLLAQQAIGRAKSSLLWQHSDREQGAPKLALVPAREARVSHQRELFALRTSVPIDAWDGELALGTQALAAETVVHDPLFELGRSVVETRTPGHRVEQSFELSQELVSNFRLRQRLGIALDRFQRFERRAGALEPALTARRLSTRLAGAAEFGLTSSLFVDTTLAVTCNATSTAALGACDEVEPDGRVGVSFRRSSYELYANAGRYHRAATLGELHGVALLVRGNDELLPERGQSYELGFRFQVARRGAPPPLFVDVAGFARRSEQLITYVRTAQGYLSPVNRNRSSALGAELMIGGSPVHWFEATSQLSLLDQRDTSPDRVTSNDVLPFSSRLASATLGTFKSELWPGAADEAGLTLKWIHQSSRYADPAGLGVIPEQDSLDVEVFLRSLERRLVTRARVANALDASRFDVVGFPLPGRSIFASLEATW